MKYKYVHRVKYYETDKMGITHHSNYVRWMEEARVSAMDEMGYSFKKVENLGFASPMLEYNVKIMHSSTFDDNVEVVVWISEYNGLKMKFGYEMFLNDKLIAKCESVHCFTNVKTGFPVRLNKSCKEIDDLFREVMN